MTNIINQNTFEKFKTIREEYVAYMKALNDDFIKQVIQELKLKYGDFAIVVRVIHQHGMMEMRFHIIMIILFAMVHMRVIVVISIFTMMNCMQMNMTIMQNY